MIGGSSLIPSVQQVLTRIFGGERVMIDRPLEAVACGAAAFAAGIDVYDHIQHDYAIRFVDPQKGGYDYRPIVRRGRVPDGRAGGQGDGEGVARRPDEARDRGVRGRATPAGERSDGGAKLELVFDPAGRGPGAGADERGRRAADALLGERARPDVPGGRPASGPGEPRFEVHFGVDANKRLVLSAKDVQTGRFVYENVPVVKLS
jgi:hypothetical protein